MSYKMNLKDGGKVVLLYTNNFTWKDSSQGAMLDYQPVTGRVYRAFIPPNENTYYLKLNVNPDGKQLPKLDGLRISSLSKDTPEWSCNFTEIDDDSILELPITTEDYAQIAEWASNSHKDFIDLVYSSNGFDVIDGEDDEDDIDELSEITPITEEELREKVLSAFSNSITPYSKEIENNIKFLAMRNPYILQALTFITSHMVAQSKAEDMGPIIPLSHEIAMSSEFGKGANMYKTTYNLDKYINTNGDSQDLLKAIDGIILEMIRIQAGKK